MRRQVLKIRLSLVASFGLAGSWHNRAVLERSIFRNRQQSLTLNKVLAIPKNQVFFKLCRSATPFLGIANKFKQVVLGIANKLQNPNEVLAIPKNPILVQMHRSAGSPSAKLWIFNEF